MMDTIYTEKIPSENSTANDMVLNIVARLPDRLGSNDLSRNLESAVQVTLGQYWLVRGQELRIHRADDGRIVVTIHG